MVISLRVVLEREEVKIIKFRGRGRLNLAFLDAIVLIAGTIFYLERLAHF